MSMVDERDVTNQMRAPARPRANSESPLSRGRRRTRQKCFVLLNKALKTHRIFKRLLSTSNVAENWRFRVSFADQTLRGAKPNDLPAVSKR